MREILFKGLDEDDKTTWHYGYYTKFNNKSEPDTKNCITTIESNLRKIMGIIPESLCEFSSFYDTAEKPNRIFEGDIIRIQYADDTPSYIIIEFRNGTFGYKSVNPRFTYFLSIEQYDIETYNWLVVGNIHTNKISEFLKPRK